MTTLRKLITDLQELAVELQRKPFGSTGLSFPPIVFGSTSLGNLFAAPTIDQKRDIVKAWFDNVDKPVVIDTAGKYGAGLALEMLGQLLKELQVSPDDVIISNKLAWQRIPLTTSEPTFEPGVWCDLKHDAVQDISYDGILRCHEMDCELLGDYYPQLVSVHDPDEYLHAAKDEDDLKQRNEDVHGAYEALMTLKRDGKVTGVGVGAKDWTTIRDISERIELDWLMIANSFTIHSHPPDLVSFIGQQHAKGVAIINSAVFNGGFVVGGNFYNYQPIDANTKRGKSLIEWREKFNAACKEMDVSVGDAGIAFGLSHPGINAVALSSSRPQRVQGHVQSIAKSLPSEFWARLKENRLIDRDYPHL